MNRRLMMAQQNKGFELVYDPVNGLLPTECGWKRTDSNPPTAKIVDGLLEITDGKTSGFVIEPDVENTDVNCSLEVEFCFIETASQALALKLEKHIPCVNFFLATNVNAVRVYQDNFQKPLIKLEKLNIGIWYKAKVLKEDNKVYCFINDELVYHGVLENKTATKPADAFSTSGGGTTLIKKLIYKLF